MSDSNSNGRGNNTSWSQWGNYILKEIDNLSVSMKLLESELKGNNTKLSKLETDLVVVSSTGKLEVLQNDIEHLKGILVQFQETCRQVDDRFDNDLVKLKAGVETAFEVKVQQLVTVQETHKVDLTDHSSRIEKLNDFKTKATAVWAFSTFLITVAIGVVTAIVQA